MNRRDFLRNTIAAASLLAAGDVAGAALIRPRYTADIIMADVENSNERIYPRETVESIMRQINSKTSFGKIGLTEMHDVFDLTKCGYTVSNARMVGPVLKADITPLDTPSGHEFAALMESQSLVFRPAGTANRDGKNVVDYTFVEMNAIQRGKDSYNGILY